MDCVIKRWLFIIPTCFLNWTHGQLFQEHRRKKANNKQSISYSHPGYMVYRRERALIKFMLGYKQMHMSQPVDIFSLGNIKVIY